MSRVLRVFALLSLFGAFAVLRPTVAPALLLPQDIAPYHIQEYWYLPTFYPSVNEAVSALIGIQTKVVQWQGGWVEWTINPVGAKASGIAKIRQETGVFTPGKLVDFQEQTVIPFSEVKSLHLVFIEDRGSHPYCLKADLKNGVEIFRTRDIEIAKTLYNSLASLLEASGNELDRPDIGATFRDVTADDLWIPGLKEAKGMIVTGVAQGGPAEKGGLRVRDAVVSCNGKTVMDHAQWREKILPGTSRLEINVLRKSEPPAVCIVEVFPGEQYPATPPGLAFSVSGQPGKSRSEGDNSPPKMGFSLRYPDEAELKALGGKSGAVIAELVTGGAAEKAGLQKGDILVECNGKPIASPETLGALLSPGENTFLVVRNGQNMIVKLGATLVSY
ncbi:MAG: PDZ domain-containing protein [Synergistaceae bacterium]|nr:PDZ domain-containing protein [Synergistaceae bacterium]